MRLAVIFAKFGATERSNWTVILPLSRPILAALAVFLFLANWNSFLWPLTITTDEELWLVQVAIATFHDEYAAQWNYVVAASTVVASPTLILFFLFQQKLIEAIKISALK
jgi:multiple sugar transport system permease protein